MTDLDIAEVVHVVKKTRVEEHPNTPNPLNETFIEVQLQDGQAVSEEMADYIWHEHGIEVENKGIEVRPQNDR